MNRATRILERDYLKVKLKTPGLEVLGVMLDADTNSQGRYESVRNLCVEMFPQMPEELPAGGMVTENAPGYGSCLTTSP